MKLIIDIPEEALKEMKTEEFISIESLDTAIECIKKGTPLDSNSERAEVQAYFAGQTYGWEEGRKALIDDLKAEIQKMPTDYCGGYIGLDKNEILKILDNVGRKEGLDG